MAPLATAAHQTSGSRKRYMATELDHPAKFQSDLASAENYVAADALQPVESTAQPEWEGFISEEEYKEEGKNEQSESSSEENEESDSDSINIDIEREKQDEPVIPKDAEEEELEHIIFGDSAGFQKNLGDFSLDRNFSTLDDPLAELSGEQLDLNNVADQDLFFFDSGPVPAPGVSMEIANRTESDEEIELPAWEDSDDDRLVVSLASVPQLRKLRETAADDIVSGKEYSKRLRKQYERLYPTPNWALHATGTKRRRTRNDEESDGGSTSEMDVDEEDISTQPLARLLKDADILSRTSRNPVKRRKLQAGTIDIQRLKDVTKSGPSAITSLSFHPNLPLLLSSGSSSTLYLHHINPNPPNPNPLLTSVRIKNTPLTTTAFHPSPSDSRIFLSARRRYFHVWNISTGKVEKISRIYGHQHEQRTMEHFSLSPDGKHIALRGSSRKGGGVINILDALTLQWVTQVRIESRGGVADFVWWGEGGGLSIAGKNGEVTEWSIEHGVIGRWNDEGAIGTTVIALGGKSGRNDWLGGDRWVAMGSSSGIVNIYDRRAWVESQTPSNGGIPKAPSPMRTVQSLTTPISHLQFSADGQILAIASRWKNNAMKLIHLPSGTAFKNWPTEKTPLGRITAVAWGSPSKEEEQEGSLAQLAVANEAGAVRIWEVRA